MTLARRLKAMGQPKYARDGDLRTSGPGFGLTLHPDTLEIPRRWRKPRTVFVNSMSDLFHPDVPVNFIRRVFDVMASTPQHTYQVLTKRAQRLAQLAPALEWPPNVWMGVSVEADRYSFRAERLRTVAAAVRFLSLEPLLGPVPSLDLAGIDWVIVGGETGTVRAPLSSHGSTTSARGATSRAPRSSSSSSAPIGQARTDSAVRTVGTGHSGRTSSGSGNTRSGGASDPGEGSRSSSAEHRPCRP